MSNIAKNTPKNIRGWKRPKNKNIQAGRKKRSAYRKKKVYAIYLIKMKWIVCYSWVNSTSTMFDLVWSANLKYRQIASCTDSTIKSKSPRAEHNSPCYRVLGSQCRQTFHDFLACIIDTVKPRLSAPALCGNLSWRHENMILKWLNFSHFFVRKFRL